MLLISRCVSCNFNYLNSVWKAQQHEKCEKELVYTLDMVEKKGGMAKVVRKKKWKKNGVENNKA